jgi:SAM-dependent methyltransferase
MQQGWQVKVYSPGYDDPSLRGLEDPRPWDLLQVIRGYCSPSSSLLDIGCGTGRKTLPIAPEVRELWGLEPSDEMRNAARELAAAAGAANFQIVKGTAEELPFPDERFDVAISVMAPHSTAELWRVLKPGGIALLEKIGERDKRNIKALFGDDDQGPRGQFVMPDGERERVFRSDLGQRFERIEVRSGSWRTVFSRAGLIVLLQETITIRNFDPVRDAGVLRRIETELSSERGIETIQHRLLFVARKAA